MKQIRRRLTYANVVSTLCLFLLLGGGAYAATQLPKNSVGTKQLKKRAVDAAKLRRNSVNSAKVRNHSLRAVDFRAGQLPAGPQGERGEPGPRGAKGEPGPKGETGENGATRTEFVVNGASIPAYSSGDASVGCPEGTKVTGGGALDQGVTTAYLYQSAPIGGGTQGWEVFYKTGADAITAYAYAICASP